MVFSWSPSWCSQWLDRHWGIKCSRCSCQLPLECESQGQTLLPADKASWDNSLEKWDKPWRLWPISDNLKRNTPGILNHYRSCSIYRSWCTFLHLLGLRPENIHHDHVTHTEPYICFYMTLKHEKLNCIYQLVVISWKWTTYTRVVYTQPAWVVL